MPPSDPDVGASRWWRDGILYQIYPRSFADSTGTDTATSEAYRPSRSPVVARHRRHLAQSDQPLPGRGLGIRRRGLHRDRSRLRQIEDLDRLVAEAADRGIRILIDLVPNHTSDRHPWFVDARSSRSADHRDWYVWVDGGPDGSPPNNWRSSFGGPAWTWDDATSQYFLHNFLPEQPDLNWWNPAVADAFDDIVRFWLDRGLAGFRIDVAHALVKDRDLRDDTPALETDHPSIRATRPALGFQYEPTRDPRRVATVADDRRRLPGVLLGETWVLDLQALGALLRERRGRAPPRAQRAVRLLDAGRGDARDRRTDPGRAARGRVALWNGSNHDAGRFPLAMVRRRRATQPSRARDASHASRNAVALLRRRDRDEERRRAPRPAEGPGGHPPLAGRSGPGQRQDADAVDPRRRASPRPTSSHGSRWARRSRETSPTSARITDRCSISAAI